MVKIITFDKPLIIPENISEVVPPTNPPVTASTSLHITYKQLLKFMKCVYKDMLKNEQIEEIALQMLKQYSITHPNKQKLNHTANDITNTNSNKSDEYIINTYYLELNEFYTLLSSIDVLQLLSIHL